MAPAVSHRDGNIACQALARQPAIAWTALRGVVDAMPTAAALTLAVLCVIDQLQSLSHGMWELWQ